MLEPSRVIGVRENLVDLSFCPCPVWFRVVVLLVQIEIERAAGGEEQCWLEL